MKLDPEILYGNRTNAERTIAQNVNPEVVGENILKTRILNAYTLYIDKYDLSLAKDIKRDGYWEFWITRFLGLEIQPGWTVIDVGANFGYYTMLFADLVTEEGQVWAFEPNNYLANLIYASTTENGFENVNIERLALSNYDGETMLHYPGDYFGNASIKYNFDDYPEYGVDQSSPVRVQTLDSINIEHVDMIKIDAEGSEADILEGAKETLARNPKARICMEWLLERIENPDFIKEWEEKYNIYIIPTEGRYGRVTSSHDLRFIDWEMLYLIPK